MQTFETTDQNLARRRRSAQYRWLKTTVTVTGIVHSVKEVASSYPARWIVTVVDSGASQPNLASNEKPARRGPSSGFLLDAALGCGGHRDTDAIIGCGRCNMAASVGPPRCASPFLRARQKP
jgi:hypothetical protein